jgi:hypothetical protein
MAGTQLGGTFGRFFLDRNNDGHRDTYNTVDAVGSFHERYVDSRGSFEGGQRVPGPPLDALSGSELVEYRALVATAAKSFDMLIDGVRLFDLEAREILDGIPTENALTERMRADWGKEGREPSSD